MRAPASHSASLAWHTPAIDRNHESQVSLGPLAQLESPMAIAGVGACLHGGGQEGAGAVGRLERPPGHAALRRRGRPPARLADHPPLAGMPLSHLCWL